MGRSGIRIWGIHITKAYSFTCSLFNITKDKEEDESSGDDVDDEKEDEDEEEEHPALADSVPPPVHRVTARMSIRAQTLISLPSEL
ncbi:hypothetical protein Tco_0953674 [Tanacetum coccineum]|uniref:Uncharacterized protein n=1 Tax=Tanacetum coccineum TaxID=301880 RepID=A0ABQ5E1J3_9ASTR